MKYIVDIKGEIEGDYEIIGKYEERPQGEWLIIEEPDGLIHAKCSNCNQFNDWGDVAYCPWCGAKMKGAKEL